MRYRKVVNVQEILKNSHFADLMQKGLLLYEVNEQLQKKFPVQFNGLYKIADIQQDTLYIHVANSTIRQGFLFKQQELLDLIQTTYPQITKLNIKINPEVQKQKER